MSNSLSCPKFSKCSAPIRPIDTLWELRTMRISKSVCFYLLEHAEADSKARFEGRGPAGGPTSSYR